MRSWTRFVGKPSIGGFSNVRVMRGQRGRPARCRPDEGDMTMRGLLSLLVSALALTFAGMAGAQDIDWKKVDAALGKTGAVQGSVHRYGLPRSDLRVTVDDVAIKPALALGGAMLMGDVVLTETEIKPVMTKLLEGGVEITALHNHLLRTNPATYYMHVGGHGDPVK